MKTMSDPTVKLQLRLPKSMHGQLLLAAGANDRSLNWTLVFALKSWLSQNAARPDSMIADFEVRSTAPCYGSQQVGDEMEMQA